MHITEELKKTLENRFRAACLEIGEADIQYVLEKFDEKYDQIDFHAYPKKIQICFIRSKLFKKLIEEYCRDQINLDKDVISALTAALIYFLNPWDLLPDQIPIKGFDDDAYVIDLCFNLISQTIDIEFYTEKYSLPMSSLSILQEV